MKRTSPNDASRNTRSGKTMHKTSTPTTTSNSRTDKQTENESNWQVLYQQNKEILKKLTEVENAVQFLSSKYDELKIMYDSITSENTALKQVNTNMTIKINELQNNNIELHNTVNEIKQNEIKNNVVIFGVPKLADQHSLELTFNKILAKLNIPHDAVNIDDIFQKKTRSEFAPIFIKFRSYKNKIDFKQAAKLAISSNKNYLYATDIGFNKNNKIFFADQLTEVNQNILREAKKLRAHGYKYVWAVNGRIMVKRDDDSDNVIIIKTLNCIESLKTQNSTI